MDVFSSGFWDMDVSRREAISLSGTAVAGASLATQAQAIGRVSAPAGKWWMDEPIRMALVLFDQTRPPLDTDAYIDWLVDLGANAVYVPTGGIAAFYPTKVPFHFKATGLPSGRDLVGEIVRKAHARGIRVISRFEWSFHQDPRVLTAHPDWMQRNAAGDMPPVNGAYLTCVNGGYVREQALQIMGEVIARYPIDGVFFNGVFQRQNNGPCHCDNCQRLFHAKYNRGIPDKADDDYLAFINASMAEATEHLTRFLREKRPDAGFNLLYGRDADSRNDETHSAPVASANAYWLYQASETVNRLRATEPDKMAFNNDAVFLDGYWRYVHRAAPDGEIRAYQNMANGAGPFLFVNGPIKQFDGNGLKGARPAFQFHKAHQDLYVRQENAARVLLLDDAGASKHAGIGRSAEAVNAGNGGFGYRDTAGVGLPGDTSNSAMRGFFRLLTEQHIPFALSSRLDWIDSDPGRYDLVICPKGVPAKLDAYLRGGGRVLAAGAVKPELELPPVVKLWKRQETLSSYWRVRDRRLLPSLADADLLLNYSDFLELEPRGAAALTYVPSTITIPMEKVGEGMADTTKSGLYLADYGKGRLAYLPWDIGDLYYRTAAVNHAALVGDLVDHLLPGGRQVRTNAHPMVQITVQQQRHKARTLVHLVNLSGCSQVAYHPAIPMSGIQLDVAGPFQTARLVSQGRNLPVRRSGGYASVTVPSLDTYDVVVLS
jgi:hypothetical protein